MSLIIITPPCPTSKSRGGGCPAAKPMIDANEWKWSLTSAFLGHLDVVHTGRDNYDPCVSVLSSSARLQLVQQQVRQHEVTWITDTQRHNWVSVTSFHISKQTSSGIRVSEWVSGEMSLVRLRAIWITNHPPSVLWHCWLGHLTCKTIVSEMT